MDSHRSTSSFNVQYITLEKPFSCFDFIDDQFGDLTSIRRCFSLARSFGAKTLIIEDIPAKGMVADENLEITDLYSDYTFKALKRLSFWKKHIRSPRGVHAATNDDLVGYALLKWDLVPSQIDRWHIFEAVFRKYDHDHNCVPCPASYRLHVLEKAFDIKGVLYCQQNGLNKACAHVALRSLLSRVISEGDLSYRRLNELAAQISGSYYDPANGLDVNQMQGILKAFGVEYVDLDYDAVSKTDPDIRKDVPYQKYLYAGIESGCGGLLGFSMSGPRANSARHIIPFYGHTFNKDTWAPDANINYFDIGGGVGYIPSEGWTSSFIGHDDNFGPNFCIPRLYVKPEQVQYVVELKKGNAQFGGIIAEAQALQILYSLNANMAGGNRWMERLRIASHPVQQDVVLRAVCVSREDYLSHLKDISDWNDHVEQGHMADALSDLLPELLWVVEISIPHLFPANERKLGEIVLNATQKRDSSKSVDYKLFLLARFPACYYLLNSVNQHGPNFITIPSKLESHTPVIRSTQ